MFLVSATLFLIVAGALVTSHDAGLAAPDWPLSYGQVFPKMVGNLFWEHGHRLIATTVGMLTIVMGVWLWRSEPRRWVRRLGLAALITVVTQGLLGGATVLLQLPLAVSVAHACLAQIFFSLTVVIAIVTSPKWNRVRPTAEQTESTSLRYLSIFSFGAVFIQLLLGAVLRHSATWDQHLPTGLLLLHIGGAVAVALIIGSTVRNIVRRFPSNRDLMRPAIAVGGILAVQIGLGLAAYVTRLSSPYQPQPLNPMVGVTAAHVAVGALLLASTLFLTIRVFRVFRADQQLLEVPRKAAA